MTDASAVESTLAERPDLADALKTLLEVDEREDGWTFDDVDVESGRFGELVSRDVVVKEDDEYRLADPAAVRASLDADDPGTGAGASERGVAPRVSSLSSVKSALDLSSLAAVDRTAALLLGAALAFVGLVRAHPISAVYRDGHVVLSGNDPYFYRYWVERVVAESGSVLDVGALAALPSGVRTGEPLFVTTAWFVSELLGGGTDAVGHVLAWYPVAAAVVTAGLVYLLATSVTRDRRVGLASVLLFAIVPGHAMRTSLGFADHHAFDYPWLAATALALVVLVDRSSRGPTDRRTWVASAGLGLAVAGQTLAWEAAPLLLVPVGLVALGQSLSDVRADASPLARGAPIAAGLGLGAVLTAATHLVVGWHEPVVAFAPALLLAAVLGVLAVGEGVSRTTGDVRHLLGIDAMLAVLGVGAVSLLLPGFWSSLDGRLDALFVSEGAVEAIGIFSPETFGFLFLFGFALVLALPVLAWSVWRVVDDHGERRWLPATVYAAYFLLLSTVQARFVGELAPFVAVFAGAGFVWTAAWVDAIPRGDWAGDRPAPLRIPDGQTIGVLAVLFLLVGSLGAVQVPVKTGQLTIDDDAYRSAAFVADRSDRLDQSYPENYVLSSGGRNRMYNYFVNGESARYAYADRNYADFLRSTDPDSWYDEFDGRVGYVVVEPGLSDLAPETAHERLGTAYGSRSNGVAGVAHFRPLYVAPGETRIVFGVVPGANVTGQAEPGASVTVTTNVTAGSEAVSYSRQVTASESGEFSVRVANPGTYRVSGGETGVSVDVPEAAVEEGGNVTVTG